MSARKTVSTILPSIAVVLAIAGVMTLLPLPVAFTDTAQARKPHRGPPPVTRSGVAQPGGVFKGTAGTVPRERRQNHTTPRVTRSGVATPPGSSGKFGGNAVQDRVKIDLGLDFKPSGPRAQHQDHTTGRNPPRPRGGGQH